MKALGIASYLSAATVFVVCVVLIYLRQSPIKPFGTAESGNWKWDDPFALYFAAKRVFCAMAIILLYQIYAAVASRKN